MLQYVIAGLVYGGIYAIAASGLVVTYQSTGILNFAFASLAYAVARFYYYLNTQEHWAILPAALVSIVITGPALGIGLYFALFRRLRLARPLIKVVATIGVSVAIPPAATLIFGNETILSAPGLAPEPVRVFDFMGVAVTMEQIIVYICVAAHRRRRSPGPALHRHRPPGAGHGRLTGNDVTLCDQPGPDLHGRLGGEHRSRRARRGAGGARRRPGPR